MVLSRLSRKSCVKTVIRQQLSESGWKSLPTGFDYWKLFPVRVITTIRILLTWTTTLSGRKDITNLITDMSIDWMENSRDKKKPFCLLIHHKAIHRNWLPEIKIFHFTKIKSFHLPENFHDDYEGRIAAASQEMGIAEDMDLIYDLKMLKDGQESRLKKDIWMYTEPYGLAWAQTVWRFYAPITEEFYKLNLKGKELAEWKYQRYMRDYMKVVKSFGWQCRKNPGLFGRQRYAGKYIGGLYLWSGILRMGEHGWFDKRFMYEESMHTPLLMHLPKGLKGKRRNPWDGTEHRLYSYLSGTFGIPVPEDMHGVSLLPLLRGEHPVDWRKALYYHFMNIRQSIWLNVITEYGQTVSNLFILQWYWHLGAVWPEGGSYRNA